MPPQSSPCTRRLYNCTRTASAFAQVEPSDPVIAIHMMAPGPPLAIEVATPAILSTPTREDRVKARVWNGDKPPSPDSLSLSWRIISGRRRNCTALVTKVKKTPTAKAKYASGFQIQSLTVVNRLMSSSTRLVTPITDG